MLGTLSARCARLASHLTTRNTKPRNLSPETLYPNPKMLQAEHQALKQESLVSGPPFTQKTEKTEPATLWQEMVLGTLSARCARLASHLTTRNTKPRNLPPETLYPKPIP